jgi:phosphohistidine phosphatase
MLLLIMRHGEAEAKAEGERYLTKFGATESRKALEQAKNLGAKVNAISCSPLARAKETAQIASQVFNRTYEVSDSLEPESSPERVYEELVARLKSDMLIISHQPLVSKLLSDLLGVELSIPFGTSTIAVLSIEGEPGSGSGTLVSLIPASLPTS